MKEIACYKFVEIKSMSELTGLATADVSNTKNPIVINLEKLSPINYENISILENVVSKKFHSIFFPYPVFILGTVTDYTGHLTFFKTKADLPSFYPFKGKTTAKIHSDLLHYNQIAQREYECINYEKARETIQSYADIQKKIYNSFSELQVINKILNLSNIDTQNKKTDF